MKTTQLLLLLLSLLQSTSQASLFKANSFLPSYYSAISASSGDINGDGFSDVVLATQQQGNILLYLNDQNHGFKVKPFNVVRSVVQIDLADMNGDGNLDLLVFSTEGDFDSIRPGTSSAFSYLEVFFNSGTADFNMTAPGFTFGTNGKSHAFRVADFNQDGHLDIFTTVSGSTYTPNLISYSSLFYLGRENGSFESAITDVNLQRGSRLADFNQDGYLDIWNLSGSPKVHIYDEAQGFVSDNTQNVYFEPSEPSDPNIISHTTISFSDVALGDLDGDGDVDVQAFTQNGELRRYLKDGENFVPTALNTTLPLPFDRLDDYHASRQYGVLLHLNNDGKLVTWIGSNESENILLVGDSIGQPEPEVNVISTQPSNRFGNHALVDDFNADGKQDVLSIGANGLTLWANQGDQSLKKHQTNDGRWGLKSIVKVGLVDADNYLDVVLAGRDGVGIKKGNGQGSFASFEPMSNQSVSELVVADLDNNGRDEVLGLSADKVFKWEPYQNDEQTVVFQSLTNEPIKNLQTGDFNYDGQLDLAFQNHQEQLVIATQSNGGFTNSYVTTSSIVDFAVVKQQGNTSILLYSHNELTNYEPGVIQIGFENGQGWLTDQVITMSDFSLFTDELLSTNYGTKMKLADFDLDGDLDVSIPYLRPIENGLIWLSNEGGDWQVQMLSHGENGWLLTAKEFADFNADGLLDTFGSVNMLTANGSVTQQDYLALGGYAGAPTGQGIDFNLRTADSELADIDGDGDMDLVQIGWSGFGTQLNTSIDVDFSGLWFNPDENGHGLQLEQIESNGTKAINFSWFAYHQGKPFWLVGIAPLEGQNARIPVSFTRGTGFGGAFNSADVEVIPWGFVDLELNDERLNLAWETNHPDFVDGQMQMQRLAVIKAVSVKADVLNSCHSGSWYNPSENGHGFFVDVVKVADETQMTLAWYHYLEGKQNWVVAQGPVFGNLAQLTGYSGNGGLFPPNFESTQVALSEWGYLQFEMLSQSKANISWTGTSAAFPPGELMLEKLTALDRYQCQQ